MMLEAKLPPGAISNNITSAIKSAEEAAKSSPFGQRVDIMAVVKYASDENTREILADGRIKIFGESRVQDARERWLKNPYFAAMRGGISLHFIGHLQTNKTDLAAKIFDSIDSLDSIKLASELDKSAGRLGKKIPVMIQLKISGSETQYGIDPDHLESFMEKISGMPGLAPRGVMAIGPNTGDEKKLSEAFLRAKKAYDFCFKTETGPDGYKNYFSAGMSEDFKTAVRSGSNLVRLGSLLFRTDGGIS